MAEQEQQRGVVVLALGVIAAVIAASALIVLARDLAADDPEPTTPVPSPATSSPVPEPSPQPSAPPTSGCRKGSAHPSAIAGQAAGRRLCQRFGDPIRTTTDAMFECEIGDRIEDCREPASEAWQVLSKIKADPDYREARALLDGAFELAEQSGESYLSPTCRGPNELGNRAAEQCTTDYSSFGVGLSALEYQLRST